LRIVIVGAGAIGCLFGIRLHGSGQSIVLIHHNRQTVASIRNKGVTLKELSGRIIRRRVEVNQSLSERDHPDLVVLTVKAYDTEMAARSLKRQVGRKVPILSLQNGLGNIETLSRYFPASSIIAGTTTEAALQTRPGLIAHTGRGFTWIGEVTVRATKRCITIKKIFRNAGFRTETSSNINGVIWSKAIVNSAINPISALARVPNKDLLRIANLTDASRKLISEGLEVAQARGVRLSPRPALLLSKILASSGKNRSSMLQDIETGKRTEIRQLNGWLAAIGKRLGVRTPYNSLIAQLVLGLEASKNLP